MKLTGPQQWMLKRGRMTSGDGREFIILTTPGEDRTAKALESKGFGVFINNGWQYSWRKRDGYTNTFYFNANAQGRGGVDP